MILRVLGHSFQYECENLCRLFYPNEKIITTDSLDGEDPLTVSTRYENGIVYADLSIDGENLSLSTETSDEDAELNLAKLIYKGLSEITGYTPPWGVLTGVRPSKLMLRMIESEGEESAVKYFTDSLLVDSKKAELALTVAKAENEIVNSSSPESFSLYVSIPFCPSRCSYCSFVSHSIANPSAKKLVPEYLDKLCEEIAYTGKIVKANGLKLESIYFGGGTPGVLEAPQFDKLACAIEKSFDISTLKEYTVEIGRPDTVTAEKLAMLKRHNVGRISINPQTFNQETLDLIGRQHTVQMAVDAYRLARRKF